MSSGALGPLGLSEEQEAFYLALLESQGDGDERSLPALAPESLDSLVRAGLMRREDGRWQPAPPGEALGILALRRMDEVRVVQRHIEQIAQRFETRGQDSTSPPVEVVRGAEAMAARYALVLRSAREEICSFVKSPAIATTPEENVGQRDALRSGVRFRVVYDRETLESGALEFPLQLKELAGLGEEMRVAFEVPFKMVVIDRRTVVLAQVDPPGPYVVLLRHPLLATVCQWVFETVWDWGLPVSEALSTASADELSAGDRRLLGLLLGGHTDESVAKHLEVSVRTVQRRVQRLLRLAGAQSRVQLGWQAARRNWI